MKTSNSIQIGGAKGEFSEISGSEITTSPSDTPQKTEVTKSGVVVLKNVVFEDQPELWAGYGTPLEREGTVVIEQKEETGSSVIRTLADARATKFSTGRPVNGEGPTFNSIELSYESITTEVHK